ncbi:MAG: YidB family protein [Anaeromyxobacter sp.]
MGLLDDLTKNLGGAALGGGQAGGGAQGGQGALMQAAIHWLSSGGLQQVMGALQQQGLGHLVDSWVSTGANKSISPDQLGKAIGPDQLGKLAKDSGLDTGAVTQQLSTLLPGLVDKLSPGGKLPDLGAVGGLLKGLF